MAKHHAIRGAMAATAALAACLSLAACGDDDPAETKKEPVGPSLTAPATMLELGDQAIVPIGDDGLARLTVTKIEDGRPADLKAFGKDAKAAVSYVWIKVAPISGDVTNFASYDHIHGWSGDDLVPHVLTDPKPYAPCPTRYFPDKGPIDALETCTVFTNATPIDRVGFHDSGDYQRNEDEISWR